MLKKILISAMFFLWLVVPTLALGEEMPIGKWWRVPQIAERLNLSDDHRRRLDDLFINNRRRLIELKGILERERFELDNALNREPLDEEAVMVHFRRLEAARSGLAAERFRYLLGVRKIVGLERFQRLESVFRGFRGIRPRALERRDY